MSADAKVWSEEREYRSGVNWHAIHDGECRAGSHQTHSYGLVGLLRDVESCLDCAGGMRWEFRTYSDGRVGLSGYLT